MTYLGFCLLLFNGVLVLGWAASALTNETGSEIAMRTLPKAVLLSAVMWVVLAAGKWAVFQ